MDKRIKRGCVAQCSQGILGLVDCDYPVTVFYRDGNIGTAWTGVSLSGDIGKPWSSRDPVFVAESVEALVEENAKLWDWAQRDAAAWRACEDAMIRAERVRECNE